MYIYIYIAILDHITPYAHSKNCWYLVLIGETKKNVFCKISLLVTKHPGTLLIMLDPSPYSGHGGFLSHGGAPKKSSIFLEDFP